jgi:TonB family protein
MNKWEDDIRRYHNGEMTPEEQHALEKLALSDPFLYEALEGTGTISEKDFSNDLKELTFKIKESTRKSWNDTGFAAASAMRDATEKEIHLLPKPEKKTTNRWVWPLRIAASFVVLVAVYFATNPLFDNHEKQLAQQTTKGLEESQESVTTDSTVEKTDELLVIADQKVNDQPDSKSKKPAEVNKPVDEVLVSPSIAGAPAIADRGEAEKEKITEDQVAEAIEESVVVAADFKQAELKKESAQAAGAKRSVQSLITTQKIIQGKVLSAEDGTPLPGVNIVVKGTTTGTVTDMQGNYQLISNTPDPTLVYSFIGLQSQEVKSNNQEVINVNLQSDVSQLSEVVVTGYSPMKDDANHEPVIKLAEPSGGRRAYDKYLKNSLRYPQQALDNKVKGRVTIQFTVHADGSLDEFNILKGLGYGCDEEVIRLVKDGPSWSPTTEDNVAVESEVRVRVKFALPE